MPVLKQKRSTQKRKGHGLLLRGFALLGLFALLFTVACIDIKKPGCTTDSDCSNNTVCQTGKCETKPNTGCTSTSECRNYETCRDGRCEGHIDGCTVDSECAAGEECKEYICQNKPDMGCKTDRDCSNFEECKAGKCDGHIDGLCKAESDCKLGETCDTTTGKCNPKDIPGCKGNGDCKPEETCDTTTGKCNPKDTGCKANRDCAANEVCDSSVGKCLLSLLGCRAEGDCMPTTTCINGFCKPKPAPACKEDDDCDPGKVCKADKCENKPSDSCGGCLADEYCFPRARTCRKKCDPANGITGNTTCGTASFCQSDTTTYKPGYCLDLPTKKNGIKKEGEDCSNFAFAYFCDGNAGLVCNESSAPKCFKACDPSKGPDSNPKCGANDKCQLDTTYSHLGGICLPKP